MDQPSSTPSPTRSGWGGGIFISQALLGLCKGSSLCQDSLSPILCKASLSFVTKRFISSLFSGKPSLRMPAPWLSFLALFLTRLRTESAPCESNPPGVPASLLLRFPSSCGWIPAVQGQGTYCPSPHLPKPCGVLTGPFSPLGYDSLPGHPLCVAHILNSSLFPCPASDWSIPLEQEQLCDELLRGDPCLPPATEHWLSSVPTHPPTQAGPRLFIVQVRTPGAEAFPTPRSELSRPQLSKNRLCRAHTL